MFRRLAVALVASLLVAAGACAKQADDTQVLTGDVAVATLRAVPDATERAGSGRFEMSIAVDTPDGVFDIVATGGFAGDQMSMEMDIGAVLAQAAEASGQTMPDGFDEPMQIVAGGTAVYMRIPMLQAVTGGTGWLSMSPDDLGLAGDSFGLGAGASDPSQYLETLRGVTDEIIELGTDDVRGVTTTHLKATIDVAKALERMPARQRELLRAQLEGLDAANSGFPIEVWVDGDGLARRMTMSFGQLLEAMGATGTATMTMDLFDYGEDIEIVVPDASDTTPFRDVMGAFGGLG